MKNSSTFIRCYHVQISIDQRLKYKLKELCALPKKLYSLPIFGQWSNSAVKVASWWPRSARNNLNSRTSKEATKAWFLNNANSDHNVTRVMVVYDNFLDDTGEIYDSYRVQVVIQCANNWVRCSLYCSTSDWPRGTCDSRKGNVEGRTTSIGHQEAVRFFYFHAELLFNVLICSRRSQDSEIWFGVTSGVLQRRQRERLLVAVSNANWELGLATVPKANGEIFDSNNSRHDMLRYFRPSKTPMRDDWLDDRECAGVELKTSIWLTINLILAVISTHSGNTWESDSIHPTMERRNHKWMGFKPKYKTRAIHYWSIRTAGSPNFIHPCLRPSLPSINHPSPVRERPNLK